MKSETKLKKWKVDEYYHYLVMQEPKLVDFVQRKNINIFRKSAKNKTEYKEMVYNMCLTIIYNASIFQKI